MKSIAEQLGEKQIELNQSGAGLAKLMGVSQTTVSRWMRGLDLKYGNSRRSEALAKIGITATSGDAAPVVPEEKKRIVIGERCYAYRREKHLTQKELAKELGCHWTSISDWEAGRNSISVTNAKRLHALGLLSKEDTEQVVSATIARRRRMHSVPRILNVKTENESTETVGTFQPVFSGVGYRPRVARQSADRQARLELAMINQILRARGQEPINLSELGATARSASPKVHITRPQIVRLKSLLREQGVAVMRRLKNNPARAEFVDANHVRITGGREHRNGKGQ